MGIIKVRRQNEQQSPAKVINETETDFHRDASHVACEFKNIAECPPCPRQKWQTHI